MCPVVVFPEISHAASYKLKGVSERKDFNQIQYVSMSLFLSELTLGVVFHNGHVLYTVKPVYSDILQNQTIMSDLTGCRNTQG